MTVQKSPDSDLVNNASGEVTYSKPVLKRVLLKGVAAVAPDTATVADTGPGYSGTDSGGGGTGGSGTLTLETNHPTLPAFD